ncbi:EamA family transporter [Chloroflexota bacterium]
MNWTSTAILSAAIFGVVNVIDSHLLSKRMPSLRAFLLLVGIIHLIYGLVLSYLFPLPEGISLPTILVAIASGILRTAAVTIMLYNLQREEVSRVIPVVYTYPIFVAILAVPLLGETLNYLQWLAIIIVVIGAGIVSVRQNASGSTVWLGKPLLLLLGSSLLLATADLTSKYVLASISFWNLYWLNASCMSVIFLLLSMRPHTIKQLNNMKQSHRTIALLIFNELLAPVAVILSLWSIERGPVSLVSTITSSRPVFVLAYALILNRVLPMFLEWQPGRKMLTLRLIATAMTVGGIAIIHLS